MDCEAGISLHGTIVLTIFCLACLIVVTAQEENSKRPGGILLRRPGARPIGPAKATSTTQAPKDEEKNLDDEYEDEEPLDEEGKEHNENAASTTTTSTEPPKKIGPIIRPFRSNDDLLNALKRRQQNSKKGIYKVEKLVPKANEDEKIEKEEASPSANPTSKLAGPRRNKFSKSLKPKEGQTSQDEVELNEQPSSPVVKRPARFNLKTRIN